MRAGTYPLGSDVERRIEAHAEARRLWVLERRLSDWILFGQRGPVPAELADLDDWERWEFVCDLDEEIDAARHIAGSKLVIIGPDHYRAEYDSLPV